MSMCIGHVYGESPTWLFFSTGILSEMCLDLVFVTMFDFLCVGGGGRLACCYPQQAAHAVVVLVRARSYAPW